MKQGKRLQGFIVRGKDSRETGSTQGKGGLERMKTMCYFLERHSCYSCYLL